MSLILDALKQSEGERQEKSGDIALSDYSQPSTPRRNWTPWLITAILLLNALALGWYLFANSSATVTTEAAEEEPAQQEPVTLQKIPAATKITPNLPIIATEKKAAKIPLPIRPLSAEARVKKPKDLKESARTTKKPTSIETSERIAKVEKKETSEATKSEPVDTHPPVNQPVEPPTESVPPQSATSDILQLEEISDELRAKLSTYEINAHIYSDVPAKRFSLINMKRHEEGDKLGGSSYTIVEILPTGIILDVGNDKVLLPLAQN